MLNQKSFEREKEIIKLEYWEEMDIRELRLYAYHHFQDSASFRCNSIRFDELSNFYFSCECFELMEDYG